MTQTDQNAPPLPPRPAAIDRIDLRPVINILGRIIVALALMMLAPAALDLAGGHDNAEAFFTAFLITGITGTLLTLATRHSGGPGLTLRQAYLLTFLIWFALPVFGALPMILGAPGLRPVDAYFESVSGLTTTGASVIVGLDGLPAGTSLWRGLLNWTGGLGIVFVAMIFLPVMRVGGMQFFRAEAFDTFGKVLPRASDIAMGLLRVYLILSTITYLTYLAIGMAPMDALINAMGTVSTGGFSSSDASFTAYSGAAEYLGALFMILAALPYVRYLQLLGGAAGPLWRDEQIRFFLRSLAIGIIIATLWGALHEGLPIERAFRESFFNIASIATGTGFFSGSFSTWEGPALIAAFILGFMGGCSGSSTGAMSSFRVLLSLRLLSVRIRQIQSPSRILPVRYDGQRVTPDVLDSLMLFMSAYILAFAVLSMLIALAGEDTVSALFAAWMALGNIGYGYGPAVATNTFVDYSDAAKWLMAVAMILGRLGLISIFVVLLPRFWQK